MKTIGIVAGSIVAVIFIALIIGLYLLGGQDESALERLRDISIIFSQLLLMITVVLLAAVVAILIWLAFKVKDQVIPLLNESLDILKEFKGTASRVSGTTSFVTEEVVRPFVSVSGQMAKVRKMSQIVTGRSTAVPDPPTFTSGTKKN